ncbi:MAG: hypothetical protein ACRC7N_05140 [Clostridium sp.]
MWDRIILKREYYLENKVKYKYTTGIQSSAKKREFIILEEDIYSVDIKINRGQSLEKKVQEVVFSEFNGDYNYVFDYKKINSSTYRIYAIKCGNRLSKLWNAKKPNRILPIQEKINKIIKKQIKDKKYIAIVMYEEYFYLIRNDNKHIVSSDVSLELSSLIEKVKGEVFYSDKEVSKWVKYSEEHIFNFEVSKIEL